MSHETYMRRCFELARLGAGHVSPNPMVGAALVYDGRIIAEGWHRRYGEAHAEVNCIRTVAPENRPLIPQSTLYCSLEPCFHYGKTPPCVDLILSEKIPRVVVSNADPNPKVAGQSFEKLRRAGVEVVGGILEAEGAVLNRAFFTWIEKNRPYIILKWAQSADGFLGRQGARTAVSGPLAQRLTHRGRSAADAILVGAGTAKIDDPRLDTRHYFGPSPLRVAFDRAGALSPEAHLLDDSVETWTFGPQRGGDFTRTSFLPATKKVEIPALLNRLKAAGKAILLVEGGATVLNEWLVGGWWDELQVIESAGRLGGGVPAPKMPVDVDLFSFDRIGADVVKVFFRAPL
jgi:diaminohydroxyphosphoribosylaminopyrimidine deaminase / 5-amino-6-(5-phosphoribosylamino)uracil reductase